MAYSDTGHSNKEDKPKAPKRSDAILSKELELTISAAELIK